MTGILIMGTRATYLIENQDGSSVCFYIHWDGDETGAANYFKNMKALLAKNPKLSNSQAFKKANSVKRLNVEVVDGHSQDLGTEYQYTLFRNGSLFVRKGNLDGTNWKAVWDASLEKFLDKYFMTPEKEQIEKDAMEAYKAARILADSFSINRGVEMRYTKKQISTLGFFGTYKMPSYEEIRNELVQGVAHA